MKDVPPIRIDLLSDTLTRPTPAMREAMAAAEVGDDVFGEDPTVNRLQETIAARLGKEAALLMPSGTMSNLVGLLVHCQRGDELLCEADCHIFHYEQAGYAQIGGLGIQAIPGKQGMVSVDEFRARVRSDNDHLARTRLVCLENTHNRASGRVLPYEHVAAVCDWAASAGLARHLDGARLMNAEVATGIAAAEWARHFDTVSICFSKGLGAPVSSALCGTGEAIQQARRYRKVLGGGMRQAGVTAAAALYALEHHVERLAEDHQHARLLADAVREKPDLRLELDPVETNIVIFHVDADKETAREYCDRFLQRGVRMYPFGPQKVRLVTHLDVSRDECEEVAQMIRDD